MENIYIFLKPKQVEIIEQICAKMYIFEMEEDWVKNKEFSDYFIIAQNILGR